eukprot:SM000325S12649  [mRNA]  locus=s325:99838:101388:- [translate_table: standard]
MVGARRVVVCESHSIPGGAAHSFVRRGFHFDSGPSFHAGLSMKRSINPLKQARLRLPALPCSVLPPRLSCSSLSLPATVLDILGESVECVRYKTWIGHFPGGEHFVFTADAQAYRDEVARVGGPLPAACTGLGVVAAREWQEVERRMGPLFRAAAALPASCLRSDPWAVLTVGRFLPGLLPMLPHASKLLRPFSEIIAGAVNDKFLRNLLDLECFVLSGMLADRLGLLLQSLTTGVTLVPHWV